MEKTSTVTRQVKWCENISFWSKLLFGIFLLSLVPMLAIAFYNYPSVDDFSYSEYVHQALRNGGAFLKFFLLCFTPFSIITTAGRAPLLQSLSLPCNQLFLGPSITGFLHMY